MKRYKVIKIIYAKNLADAYNRESRSEPTEVLLDEEVTEKEKKKNKIGFTL